MKSFLVTSALLGVTLASPVVFVDSGSKGTNGYSKASLDACRAAENCEITEGPHGPQIGFKRGEGPGTENYKRRFADEEHFEWSSNQKIQSRQEEPRTQVTLGRNTINWGDVLPQDALRKLIDENICTHSTCDTGGTSYTANIHDSICPVENSRNLEPTGQFRDITQRDHFFDAVTAAICEGVTSPTLEYSGVGDPNLPCGIGGSIVNHFQSYFVNVNRYAPGGLQGFMSVRISSGEKDEGCERVLGALGAAADAISGIAGGFFGVLENLCG